MAVNEHGRGSLQMMHNKLHEVQMCSLKQSTNGHQRIPVNKGSAIYTCHFHQVVELVVFGSPSSTKSSVHLVHTDHL